MIHLIYQNDWDVALPQGDDAHVCSTFQRHNQAAVGQSVSSSAQDLINMSLRTFDDNQSLKGFLAFSDSENQSLTPFSVTSHYCVKVLSCSLEGVVMLSVSPIYHLGLDYPEVYQNQKGRQLDPSAMLGLIEVVSHNKTAEQPIPEHDCDGHLFCYGIDAGVVFKESPIPHNRAMSLQLSVFEDCVLATFQQNEQVSTQTLTWDDESLDQGTTSDLLHVGRFPLQHHALNDSA